MHSKSVTSHLPARLSTVIQSRPGMSESARECPKKSLTLSVRSCRFFSRQETRGCSSSFELRYSRYSELKGSCCNASSRRPDLISPRKSSAHFSGAASRNGLKRTIPGSPNGSPAEFPLNNTDRLRAEYNAKLIKSTSRPSSKISNVYFLRNSCGNEVPSYAKRHHFFEHGGFAFLGDPGQHC